MSLIDNIDKVSVTSIYPTDKIVFAKSDSFNASNAEDVGGYLKKFAIPHGLTRPVFIRLKWGTDPNNLVEGGQSYRENDTNFIPSIAYSDNTNVYILTGITSGLVYYEVIGIWIDNYDNTNPLVPAFTNSPNALAFDSRLNYQKIFLQGEVPINGSTEVPVVHNRGKLSSVWVYFEAFVGEVWPALSGGAQNYFLYDVNMAELEVKMYPNYVSLSPNAPSSRRAWYTVYA